VPWRAWAHGEELTAASMRSHLQDQMVLQFPSETARDAAIPVSRRVEGMLALTTDTMTLWYWTGSAWTDRFSQANLPVGSVLATHASSDFNFTSTSLVAVTGLTFSGIPAPSQWLVSGLVVFTMPLSTTASWTLTLRFRSNAEADSDGQTGLTMNWVGNINTPLFRSWVFSTPLGTGTIKRCARIRGRWVPNSGASTTGIFASSSAASGTIHAGSWVKIRRVA
jgi:hypothetical protein